MILLVGADFFSAHGAAWERWKVTNPLESRPRFQSRASHTETYSAGSMTRGMPEGAAGRIGAVGAAVMQHRSPCFDVKLRPLSTTGTSAARLADNVPLARRRR